MESYTPGRKYSVDNRLHNPLRNLAYCLGACVLGSFVLDIDHLLGARSSLHYEAGWGIILYFLCIGLYFAFTRRLS